MTDEVLQNVLQSMYRVYVCLIYTPTYASSIVVFVQKQSEAALIRHVMEHRERLAWHGRAS